MQNVRKSIKSENNRTKKANRICPLLQLDKVKIKCFGNLWINETLIKYHLKSMYKIHVPE